MKLTTKFVQGISVGVIGFLGLSACGQPQVTTPSAPDTAVQAPAPAAPANSPAATNSDVQTAQTVDIDDLADRVDDALDDDRTLNSFDLDADDERGSIVLTGRVQTDAQRAQAEAIAQQVAPNATIDNRIVIR